jgi:hypothetical protein
MRSADRKRNEEQYTGGQRDRADVGDPTGIQRNSLDRVPRSGATRGGSDSGSIALESLRRERLRAAPGLAERDQASTSHVAIGLVEFMRGESSAHEEIMQREEFGRS